MLIERFLDYIAIERKYSPRTVGAYGDNLREFCEFLGWETKEYDPSEVDESDIKAWMLNLLEERHQSPRSVKQKLSSLSSFYKFLLRQNVVSIDITRKIVSPKTDKPLPVFFKPSEMKKAVAFEDEADDFESIRNCLIIEMLYQTGMRQAEMLGLKDADFDLISGEIRVFGKRNKERIIPIGQKLIQQISAYVQARNDLHGSLIDGTFFVHKTKKDEVVPMTKAVLYGIVRDRMGEVSTLKKHSPHVLRHTFATAMLDNGADIRTIQKLMGHASLATTQVYTHTTFEQIQKAYCQAHPRARKNNTNN